MEQLHECGQVGDGGVAGKVAVVGAEVYDELELLALEILLEVAGGVGAQAAGVADVVKEDDVGGLVGALGRYTAAGRCCKLYLAVFESGGLHHDLDAVAQSVLCGVDVVDAGLRGDGTGHGQGGDEGVGAHLVAVGLDVFGVDLGQDCGGLGLGGDAEVAVAGQGGEQHAVVGSDELGQDGVDLLDGYHLAGGVDDLLLDIDAGHGHVVDKGAHDGLGVVVVGGVGALVVFFLKLGAYLGRCALVLACGEAAAHGAEQLAVCGLKAGEHVVALGYDVERCSALGLGYHVVVDAERCVGKGCVGLGGNLVEAVAEHLRHDVHHVVGGEVLDAVAYLAGHGVKLKHHRCQAHLLLGIAADGVDGAGVVLDAEICALAGVFGHLDGREDFFNLALDVGRVDVAHDDDALLVGAVPCVVVVAQSLRGEVVDDLHGADGQAVSVLVAGIHHGQQILEDTHLAGHAAAPLLVYHAALGVDFGRVEGEGVGPVVEDEQAGVLYAPAGDGYRRDIVYGLVDGGVGVEVAAKFHAHALEPVDDALAGEVFGAVEAHVLQEVGQAALVVFLKYGADFLCDVEVGLAFGGLVVADVVGDAVGQGAGDDFLVELKGVYLRHLLLLRGGAEGCESHERGGAESVKFFHQIIFGFCGYYYVI